MDFQFNFFQDTVSGNVGSSEDKKIQKQTLQAPLDKKDDNADSSEEGLFNQESLAKITNMETLSKKEENLPKERPCPPSAREYNIPQDGMKVLENKVVVTLTGTWANFSVVQKTSPVVPTGEDDGCGSISSDSDLVPGVYEGGLKIWECTFDLMEYLLEAEIPFAQKSVLDLGCGAGLLGILALKGDAKEVHFQDYNSSVIGEITLPNVLVNCGHKHDVEENTELCLKQSPKGHFGHDLLSKCRFFYGEWTSFSKLLSNSKESLAKYDLILTSETIYNPDYYETLHGTLSDLLGIHGRVILASKAHYFGCGGGVLLFTKFVEEKNIFTSRTVKVIEKGLNRFIIELAFKNTY